MNEDATRYTSLVDYFHLLRKQWWVILLPAIACAAAAYIFSHRAAPTYQASSAVSIQEETLQLQLIGQAVGDTSSPGTNPVLASQTDNTPAEALAVKRRLHSPLSATHLQNAVSLSVDSDSGLLDITASAGTAKGAAALANAYAAQIASSTTHSAHQQFELAIAALHHRLSELGNKPADVGETGALQGDLSDLGFLEADAAPGTVAVRAQVPDSPVSPKPARNAALGFGVGALLGLILAFVRSAIDRRLRGAGEIESELGYPLIGYVREAAMGKVIQLSLAGDRRRSGDIESFRIIRRNIEQMLARVSSGTILVTSPLPQEGKSTVSASLALTAVAAGRRTLLLEADLRRPTLGKRLGLATRPGLAEYLSGEAEPAEILQALSVAVPGEAESEKSDPHAGHRLAVITAGSPMVTAAELLTSQRMRDLLLEVGEVYDMVVIDSAPLLPVADTLELLPHVRAVALCVRSSRTTRDQAYAARALLDDQPRMDVGLIVTGLRPSDEPGDYGLYAYHFNSSERIKA